MPYFQAYAVLVGCGSIVGVLQGTFSPETNVCGRWIWARLGMNGFGSGLPCGLLVLLAVGSHSSSRVNNSISFSIGSYKGMIPSEG